MSKTIYNEGRVVGLSAYDIYVRHQLSEFPEMPVVSEKEWLAASIGSGASMILRISENTPAGIHDYPLHQDSLLCAATTITASLFNGEVDLDGDWAARVTSYGPLLSNVSTSSPSDDGSTLPTHSDLAQWDKDTVSSLKEYGKIIDGLFIQPGTWTTIGGVPYKDFEPSFYDAQAETFRTGTIRLRFAQDIEKPIYILIHGLVPMPVAASAMKSDSSPIRPDNNTQDSNQCPENGDFLGPQIFPWGSKIIFATPNEVMNILTTRAYVREFPDGATEAAVSATPIIDFETSDPGKYYKTNHIDSKISIDVKELNSLGSGVSVLGTHYRPESAKFKSTTHTGADYGPALYGAKLSAEGQTEMSPIDIAAPGTIKLFKDEALARCYPKIIPNVYSLYESNGDLYVFDDTTDEEDLVPITTKVTTTNIGTSSSPMYVNTTTARSTDVPPAVATIESISMIDTSGKSLPLDGTAGTIEKSGLTDGLSWKTLLQALGGNKVIELLGTALKTFRSKLPNIETSGVLKLTGTGKNTSSGSLEVGKGLDVKGNTSVGGTLSVSDDATFNDAVTAKNGLDVTKLLTANDGVKVSGRTASGYDVETASATFKTNKPVQSGGNYIVFSNGLRLYISPTAPTGTPTSDNTTTDSSKIPIGSIGIGW